MQTIKAGCRGNDVVTLQKKLSLYPDGIFGPITEEAVKVFQKNNGLVVDGIVGPKTWAILLPTSIGRTISKIILHCTATPEGMDFTVAQIRDCHLARGFSDIGYHFVIYRDGSVHKGRPLEQIGAHCKGHNACSIGISYVGGCAKDGKTPKDTRTPEQNIALHKLVDDLLNQFPGATLHGHYEFANKACPSFKICDF